MSTVEIKDRYLRQVYEAAYARHVEGLRLGLEQHRREVAWPSTAEGSRGATSPLGGLAQPKDQRNA